MLARTQSGLHNARYYCCDCAFWDPLDSQLFIHVHHHLLVLGTEGAVRVHFLLVTLRTQRKSQLWATQLFQPPARHFHHHDRANLQIGTLRHREVGYFIQAHSVTKTEIRLRSACLQSPYILLSSLPHAASQDSRRHISPGLKENSSFPS